MKIVIQIKLLPTKQQIKIMKETMLHYISTVNAIVSYQSGQGEAIHFTSKDIKAPLPSQLRCQCANDAYSIYKRFLKEQRKALSENRRYSSRSFHSPSLPTLKKPVAVWNKQSYSIKPNLLEFPVSIDGKTVRIGIVYTVPTYMYP